MSSNVNHNDGVRACSCATVSVHGSFCVIELTVHADCHLREHSPSIVVDERRLYDIDSCTNQHWDFCTAKLQHIYVNV
jgi:hypothetical protein